MQSCPILCRSIFMYRSDVNVCIRCHSAQAIHFVNKIKRQQLQQHIRVCIPIRVLRFVHGSGASVLNHVLKPRTGKERSATANPASLSTRKYRIRDGNSRADAQPATTANGTYVGQDDRTRVATRWESEIQPTAGAAAAGDDGKTRSGRERLSLRDLRRRQPRRAL